MTEGSKASSPGAAGPVYVTGAGGFIGRHVAPAFAAAGRRVVRFGRHLDAVSGDAAGSFEGSVDVELLSRAAEILGPPALIVHAAGSSSVAASVADPATDFERTVGSLRAVLEFLEREAADARLIFLSSAAVYGSADAAPIAETSPLRPISPYGLHKKLAEDLIKDATRLRNLDAAILRLFSVYGPGNRKQLFWDVAKRLCEHPKRLELSGSGNEARDFLYIDDTVAIVRLLAQARRGEGPLVVNGGSGLAVTVREAAEALCRSLRAETEIVFTGAHRTGDPARMISNVSLADSLGFSPQVTFEAGVQRFADWARQAVAEPNP